MECEKVIRFNRYFKESNTGIKSYRFGISRFLKYEQGYLTIYMALSMTVLLSLFMTLIYGIRSNTVRLESEIIAEIGLDSILAEYHRELLDQYGLFYIDTSYGTAQPSITQTQEHLFQYIQNNCNMTDVFLGSLRCTDLMQLVPQSVKLTGVEAASDYGGIVLRKQAVEVVKEDIGLSYLKEVLQWITTVEGYGWTQKDIEQEKREIDQQIDSYDGIEKQISDEDWVEVEIKNPTQRLESQRRIGILNLVVEDVENISKAGVDLSGLFRERREQGQINTGNLSKPKIEESWIEQLLFQEYLLRYTGYYGSELEKGLLQYQTEFLIAGKDNDVDNLKAVVHRISAIREAANAMYLFSDEVKCAEAELMAAAAASAMLVPEITSLLKISILLGWSYAESLYDVKLLLEGGKVPLLKTDDTWHYDIDCIFREGVDNSVQNQNQGLSYRDYLRVLLALTDTETVTIRFMDIIEMDIRITPGNHNFRLDGCIDCVEAVIDISSGYGFGYSITRKRGYEKCVE